MSTSRRISTLAPEGLAESDVKGLYGDAARKVWR